MASKSMSLKNGRTAPSSPPASQREELKSNGIERVANMDLTEIQRRMKDSKQATMELCVDTLITGCVSAYFEFFALSHREPVCVDELANKMFVIPVDQLTSIKETLIQAEKARRSTEYREVYDCYLRLANYFEDEMDYNTALHFHQVALDNVKTSGDKELEGLAHENFGHAHERLGNTETAIRFHEAHLKLAEALKNTSLKRRVNQNLIRVYMRMAEEKETAADYIKAREMYEKSMNAARANGDTAAEGEAYHKLGNITVLLGDLDKALEYQKRFLLVSKENKSESDEGKANISLAELHEELGQVSDALASLQQSLEIAKRKGDDVAICEACSKLGLLHNKSGSYMKAVKYLEQNYEVAQRLGDTDRIDRARILLGVAKGNHYWSNGFVQMVDRNLEAMLKWKCQGVMPDALTK